jgi:hypothetical protein
MKHASFVPAFPLLAPAERPAPIETLTAPQLHVILAATRAPLKRTGRAWHTAERDRPIDPRTVRALIRCNLVFQLHDTQARLTARGLWFSRTICSALAATNLAGVV